MTEEEKALAWFDSWEHGMEEQDFVSTIRRALSQPVIDTDTTGERAEALADFDRRIDTILYILNIANEAPKTQIGGLLLRYHEMDDGSIKSLNQELEEFWQSRKTIRRALSQPVHCTGDTK